MLAAPAQAELQERQINVREACRRIIAGEFFKSYDALTRAQDYQVLLKKKVLLLDQELSKQTAVHEKLIVETNDNEFDVATAKRRDNAFAKIKNTRSTMQEYQGMLKNLTLEVSESQSNLQALKKEAHGLFIFKKIKKNVQSYPFEITYKTPCPQYHHLCPLSKKEAAQLKNLKILGETPQSCIRYAAFSNL